MRWLLCKAKGKKWSIGFLDLLLYGIEELALQHLEWTSLTTTYMYVLSVLCSGHLDQED